MTPSVLDRFDRDIRFHGRKMKSAAIQSATLRAKQSFTRIIIITTNPLTETVVEGFSYIDRFDRDALPWNMNIWGHAENTDGDF